MDDLVILHLSDLHIGIKFSKLHRALLDDIKEQVKSFPCNRLVIVVTGDIINRGEPSALENAKKFFKKLKEITEKKIKAIYIVPGNHDKKRTPSNLVLVPAYRGLLNSSNEKLFDAKFQEFLWPLQKETYKESGYHDLIQYVYNDLFCMPDIGNIADNTYGAHQLQVANKKYCFILLNTAWSCIDDYDNRNLILGKFQLEEIEKHNCNDDYDPDSVVMTFVMGHHPIECLFGTEQDALFSHMVSYNDLCANVYLCGHTHDRKVVNWSNNRHIMHTLMTGFGWPEAPSDRTHEHYYSIYKFNLDLNSMDIYVRRTNDGTGFIPDLSIYTGTITQDSDKLVRPIRFEEAQGAIELSSAVKVPKKMIYPSSEFLEFSKMYQDKLHEISLDAVATMDIYKYELFENLSVDGIGGDEISAEIDDTLLTYMNNPAIYSSLPKEQKALIVHIMEQNAPIIYENFLGFIQRLCQIFHRCLVEEVGEGQIVRFHFRYLSDKTTYTYSTLCSSFSVYDESDEDTNQPSDIKFCDLLEAAFKCCDSGALIYSINKTVCTHELNEKWFDFITVIPKFDENIYSKRVNRHTVKRFPLITFGVTINSEEHERLLQCMDFYGIDKYISNIIQTYTNLFMVNIESFLTWLRVEDKQEAS